MFTARYVVIPYIKQIAFHLLKVNYDRSLLLGSFVKLCVVSELSVLVLGAAVGWKIEM